MREIVDQCRYQLRQKIGCDRINDTDPQRAHQRILVLFGDVLDIGGLLEHMLGLRHDLSADRGHRDFGTAALEDGHAQFIFQLFDRDRERGLRDETGFGGTAKVFFTCDGDDVFQFGECHGCKCRTSAGFSAWCKGFMPFSSRACQTRR